MVIQVKPYAFLKHYIGAPAFVLSSDSKSGQIESIDMEDGSVLLKSGDQSNWYHWKILIFL
jgi:hypothetical protein